MRRKTHFTQCLSVYIDGTVEIISNIVSNYTLTPFLLKLSVYLSNGGTEKLSNSQLFVKMCICETTIDRILSFALIDGWCPTGNPTTIDKDRSHQVRTFVRCAAGVRPE